MELRHLSRQTASSVDLENPLSSESSHGPPRVPDTSWPPLSLTALGALTRPSLPYFSLQWDSYPDVLAMQFNWDGYYKEVGSAFIGSSPEFEFALYSLCFIARPGKV